MNIKRFMSFITVALVALFLVGCGQAVNVPTAHSGKILTKDGLKKGMIPPSRFRLEPCLLYCDNLVVLNTSDNPITESFELFMPEDKLKMSFDVRMTLAIDPQKQDQLFAKIPPVQSNVDSAGYHYYVPLEKAYNTYAQQIVRSVAREFMSEFKIAEIASNREVIGAQMADRLIKEVNTKTPFILRYAGLADVAYPDVITNAQVKSAERREQVAQEEAQLEISKVTLERKFKEAQLNRKIDVEKARAEAEVNKILADSMTPEYERYRLLGAMDNIATSNNAKFIPVEMLSTMASQVMLGNSK